MRIRNLGVVCLCLLCFVLTIPTLLQAQTATSAVVAGRVSDPTGAVIPGASIELRNIDTGVVAVRESDAAGRYVFANIVPGAYTLTVQSPGFRTLTVSDVVVSVAKSYTYDLSMEVGDIAETIEVTSEATVELQTTDSTVGNVIGGKSVTRLPTVTRRANELLTLQPGVTPGGSVTGARSDQSTFALDGIDVTNQSVGGTGTYIPLPVDALEEFRVGVANQNATFGRAAGGQVSVVGSRGTNDYHGSVFWYHQNDNLNANGWENNRSKVPKAEEKDNRFGFKVGGPILREKMNFFVYYDGRRFPRSQNLGGNTNDMPTASLKQGILTFTDDAGTDVGYNLASAAVCGAGTDAAPATGLCDPRMQGLSPVVAAVWNLMPPGNDPSTGDGLNFIGLQDTVSTPLENNYYTGRLDYTLTDNWRFDGTIRYYEQLSSSNAQVDLRQSPITTSRILPVRQNFLSLGVSGQVTPNLTGEFRFGFVRTRTSTSPIRPNEAAALLAIPGTEDGTGGFVGLDLGGRLVSEPINLDTQNARKQDNDNKNFQYNADMTWVRGGHTVQFGTRLRNIHVLHLRDDKVISGGLGALVGQFDSTSLDSVNRPPTCRADDPATTGVDETTTINCILSTDVQNYNRLYHAVTGMMTNINVFMVRDGDFNPLPFGTQLTSDTKLWAPEFFVQDVWRVTPSLTVTLGANYGWQLPPKEKLGRQTFVVDAVTGERLTAKGYLEAKRAAALAGQIFNPTIGFMPIESSGTDEIIETDWDNFSPRLAAAWNPSFSEGFLGGLFGERKTVLRGGYTLAFDRANTVQTVIIPALGIGFAQAISLTSPACDATGLGGAGCNVGDANNPAVSTFRVGVDGAIPIPVPPTQSIPVVPTDFQPVFPEVLSFQVDPKMEIGENHQLNFTIQRELPGDMILEIAYVGRFARELPQSLNFNNVPFMHVDSSSGQSFAQAFDLVAAILRGGGAITASDAQPWFENQLPLATCTGAGFTTCTEWIADKQSSNFINGNISNMFSSPFASFDNSIDGARFNAGLTPFSSLTAGALFMRTSTGKSNYHAALITLRKRFSRGLTFDVNYTFSKSLDQSGAIQNSAGLVPNAFDLNTEYGPSFFDARQMFNAHWTYELPFSPDRAWVNKVAGGWYVSGITTANSSFPLLVSQGSQVWGGASVLGNNVGAIAMVDPGSISTGVNTGATGSNNIGTNSDPVNDGSGLNLFGDPEAAFNSFRRVNIATDGRTGRSRPLRGLGDWSLDLAFGKTTSIGETVSIGFDAQFFNVLNRVNFDNPTNTTAGSLTNTRAFGVITDSQAGRRIQLGLRVEF